MPQAVLSYGLVMQSYARACNQVQSSAATCGQTQEHTIKRKSIPSNARACGQMQRLIGGVKTAEARCKVRRKKLSPESTLVLGSDSDSEHVTIMMRVQELGRPAHRASKFTE